MNQLRITLIQPDIKWENPVANLLELTDKLQSLVGKTDLVVMPEMFSTGFSMNPNEFGESNSGSTITLLKKLSSKLNFAFVGSFIASDQGKSFNRGFFVQPDGEVYFYAKRHLFRMGDEPMHYQNGSKRLIVSYLGWNICLQICYDLRFPVWSRNRNNEYDLLIYVANWPQPRAKVWDILLKARAIENVSYVIGVNRVGVDGLGLNYLGDSMVVDARGNEVLRLLSGSEDLQTTAISLEDLRNFRTKFPTWKDADDFSINL